MIPEYFFAFFITILIELVMALLMKYASKKVLLTVLLMNVITHPLLILLLSAAYHFTTLALWMILLGELIVILAEWRILVYSLEQEISHPLLMAILLNLASYLAGFVFF